MLCLPSQAGVPTKQTGMYRCCHWSVLKRGFWHAKTNTMQTCRYMPGLVQKIVRDVLQRLGRPALLAADTLVDVESRVADIKQRLASSNTRVLGLHGMGGIGKTTLATAVFNDLHAEFAGASCFLEVGREAGRDALLQRQLIMLRVLCGIEQPIICSIAEGAAQLTRGLSGARVLLCIDDIWTADQRDALLFPVGPGSRVLLTTRNAQLLPRGIPAMQLGVLDVPAALDLFLRHAEPPEESPGLALEIAEACAGLPLTLTIIRDHLRHIRSRSDWEQALLRLRTGKSITGSSLENDRLWGSLMLSLETLGSEEQRMFMDIASFMLGKRASTSLPAWGPLAQSTLQHLEDSSLASVDGEGRLTMHDQLRDMGRAIASEGSAALLGHMRVWMPEAEQVIHSKKACTCFAPPVMPCIVARARRPLVLVSTVDCNRSREDST